LPDEPPLLKSNLIDAWRSDFFGRGRLLITPHTAYFSENSKLEMRTLAAVNAKRALNGDVLRNKLN
jgi:D-3-phosphoglycerate dehydrogenase